MATPVVAMNPLDKFIDALRAHDCRPKETRGGGWHAKCPAHHGNDFDSLSFKISYDGHLLVTCHSKGCSYREIMESVGLKETDGFGDNVIEFSGRTIPLRSPGFSRDNDPDETYDYVDETGRTLFQVLRFSTPTGKTFRQRRMVGDSWEWSLGDVRRPLYRLTAVLSAIKEDREVFVVEGEKDAQTLENMGFCGTCAPGGACTKKSSWKAEWTQTLSGARVIIIPDNDDVGRKHAQIVRDALSGVAKSVRIVELPVGEKGDVTDWVESGGTADDLRRLCEGSSESVIISSSLKQSWGKVGIDPLTTPPKSRRWHLYTPEGEGLLPMGRAGILSAEGGVGKTSALLSLGIADITGRPWLGCLDVGAEAEGKNVALLLGEEELEEIHRRVWSIAKAMELYDSEREAVAEKLFAIPLAGHHVAMLENSNGNYVESQFFADVRELLRTGGPWSLIVIDPLSRFSGGDVESNNEVATRFFQTVESLCRMPGEPTVLVAAHSSKLSRRSGDADVRGVTGLTDAARWVATLKKGRKNSVVFEQVKSNYSRPYEPIPLVWRDGILAKKSDDDIKAEEEFKRLEESQQLEVDVMKIVETLRREGKLSSKKAIAKSSGMRLQRGIIALDLAIARGLVSQNGNAKRRYYEASNGNGGGVPFPPVPLGNAGTRSVGEAETRSAYPGERDGNAWERLGTPSETDPDTPLREPGCDDDLED